MSDTVIQPRPTGHPLSGQRMSGARMTGHALIEALSAVIERS